MDFGGNGVGFTPPSRGVLGPRPVELVQFPAETRNGAAARELDARMEARVAAVAGATVGAIEQLEERVTTVEGHVRSRSPDHDRLASATEADPTMGAVVREKGARGRDGVEHPLARGGAEAAGRSSRVGTPEEKLWFGRLDRNNVTRIAAFRKEHKSLHGPVSYTHLTLPTIYSV